MLVCKKCEKIIPDGSKYCLFCGTSQMEKAKQHKQKRSSGSGSVSKLAGRRAKPWKAVAPINKDGKRPLIGCFATKKEASDALLAFKISGTHSTKINITFAELFDEWSAGAYRDISRDTRNNYNAAYKKCTSLYGIKFRELRTADMQAVIDKHADMSKSSLEKIKALLTQMCDYAMQNDIINKNYASFISLPKKEKAVKDCFSDIELKKIELAAADGIPYVDCILMMCYTGFRISEFLELTPFNYKDGFLIGGKKTDAGRNRSVPVHPKIKPYVDKWVAKKGETIICKDNGKAFSPKYFREKCYYPALEQVGIRRLTPHATRHTLATRLASANVRVEDIQRILGHEDYEVTANTYIHQSNDSLLKAINLIS